MDATETAAFDLADLDFNAAAQNGEWMQVQHPIDGTEIAGMRVRVLGVDSETHDRATKGAQTRRMRLRRQLTGDDLEMEAIGITAACVTAWEGVTEGGREIAHSPKAVIEVLKKHRWLREQVEAFMNNRGNFTKKG